MRQGCESARPILANTAWLNRNPIFEAEILPRVEKSDVDLQQMAQQMLTLKNRVAPRFSQKIDGRTVAAIAAGATVIGVAAYFVNRFRNNRRSY